MNTQNYISRIHTIFDNDINNIKWLLTDHDLMSWWVQSWDWTGYCMAREALYTLDEFF